MCLAISTDLLHECLIQWQHAALALDHLHDHGTYMIIRVGLEFLRIAGIDIVEPFRQRIKILMKLILTGRHQRRHGPAMKRLPQRDDLIAVLAIMIRRVLARGLDHRFIGLCARVGKEDTG